jgi:ketosteroid isomerase-like protein
MTSQPIDRSAEASELNAFVERCLDGLGHQVQGDSGPFLAVWSHADDVAILGALGSYSLGWDGVRAHLLATSRSLDWTGVSVQRLVTLASGDLAVTVVLEHMTRSSGGEPARRTLRATQAYRREDGEWRLVLRHANTVTDEDDARELALREAGGDA